MLRLHFLLLSTLLFISCTTLRGSQHTWWTEETVSKLTIKLVNDPTKIEYLEFGKMGKKRIVLTTWGQAWTDRNGDSRRVTTNPALEWKFIRNHVVLYEDGNVAEELAFGRREGRFLLLRMKSGQIGRFKILDEPH
ncbi:MAG TPA: hypothetical protein VNX27_00255 [Chthoniobacterales bacterium]|jgi:hypothetical protein|nr:hypothetical protein [Chthoniobacterales bacterium]